MPIKSNTISFQGQNIYIGIDAHLKSWKVTVLLDHMEYKTFSQDPNAEILTSYLHRNFPEGSYYSAYEAGFCGFSIHRELEKNGISNIVVNPADIPTTDKDRKQKEDKRDSRKIAKSLRNGELAGIYVPNREMEELRCLVRYRKTLVSDITRNKLRVKSFLHYYGIKIPNELNSSSVHWSGRFTSWLKTIKTSTTCGEMVLEEIINTTQHMRSRLLFVERQLRELSRNGRYNKQVNQLRGIPGIGPVVAMTFLTELCEINRFKSLDKLCSYVGLVPTTHSSGDKDKTGKITPRSNKHLRRCLIEAAWRAAKQDPALALKYNELRKRMESNDAIIRIAKKLLNRIKYVLKNETEYVYAIV